MQPTHGNMKPSGHVIVSFALAVLLASSVGATRDSLNRRTGDDPVSCLSFKNCKACLEGGCSWCKGSVLGDGCLSTDIAKLVPDSVATCELPPESANAAKPAPGPGPTPGPGGGCMDAKTKKACLKAKDFMGGGCAWCNSQWQGETCMSEQQAKYIPGNKCKFPEPSFLQLFSSVVTLPSSGFGPFGPGGGSKGKGGIPFGPGGSGKGGKGGGGIPFGPGGKDGKGGGGIPFGPGGGGGMMGCMAASDKKACMKAKDFMGAGCAWCESGFQGESCVSASQASFMPQAKCKFAKDKKHHGKHHSKHMAVVAAEAGEDKPAPGPAPGPGGGGCMDAKTKKSCLKTKDASGGGCAWCDSQWQGETCMGEQQAKYMPGNKCKFPKDESLRLLGVSIAAVA